MKKTHTLVLTCLFVLVNAGLALAAGDAHHGGDAHHAESSAGLPQLNPEWYASQVFWLVIMFSVLYFIFAKTVLPALSGVLEDRREHVQNDLDMAESLKKEAEEVQNSYEKILEEARTKAADLYTSIENEISDKSEAQMKEFQESFAKEVSVMEAKLDKARKDAMKDMNTIAAEIASVAAKKIVGIDTDLKQAESVVADLSDKAKAA